MATKLKHQQQDSQAGGNVVALSRCTTQGCNKKTDLLTFCNEHYEWFKFGLINKKGERPTDFDKKFIAFQKHKKQAA
ncbi:MAG: hypothetical protein NDI61_02310 [Bdellovibrionaceae bacterium]|nr:hypothetical protein [Pseudobdellovibrionaceae bacterium]